MIKITKFSLDFNLLLNQSQPYSDGNENSITRGNGLITCPLWNTNYWRMWACAKCTGALTTTLRHPQ